MTMTNPATTAGPNADGSKSLAKESKVGLVISFLVTTLATGALGWLTNLDTSHWSGWWASVAVAAVGTVIGLITAYLKRNR
jgi:predicted CDP-diglyceride synthetase/phosphatidate cytidylyltransferase